MTELETFRLEETKRLLCWIAKNPVEWDALCYFTANPSNSKTWLELDQKLYDEKFYPLLFLLLSTAREDPVLYEIYEELLMRHFLQQWTEQSLDQISRDLIEKIREKHAIESAPADAELM